MAIAVQSMSRSGLQASYTAVATADGDAFVNDGKRTFVHVVNGATAMTVTFVTPITQDGLAVSDRTVSVGSSEEHFIGPFPTRFYGSNVTVNFSDTTNGTIAVIQLPEE